MNISLFTAFSGLRATEAQISAVSSNITNADTTGYTTKSYQLSYTSNGGLTVPTGGKIVGTVDKYLTASVVEDASENGYATVISDYLDNYSSSIGTTDSTTIATALNDLETAFANLATSSDDSSLKTKAVAAAQTVAEQLNQLSSTVQQARLQADQEISDSVDTINNALDSINTLNQQIASLTVSGQSTADLEDQRNAALETLSEQIGIQYFTTSDNRIQIYTTGGQPLVDSTAHTLSYDSATTMNSTMSYPSSLSGITIAGKDITSSISSGKLGGLLTLRDDTLPQEQDKLDQLASTLSSNLNTILNQGSSYPARSSLTSDIDGMNSSDSFSGTGTVRIAVMNSDGTVSSYQDVDLSAYTTVGSLVTALNSISGVSASLDADGKLELSADASGTGIAINEMTSSVGASSEGFSDYFGLNNLFSGSDAEHIQVSSYLVSQPDTLATATLSSSSTLAAGDQGLSSGDDSVAQSILSALQGSTSFAAAGNFSARSESYADYAGDFISDAATQASNADSRQSDINTLYTQTKSLLQNETGVNVDEETTKLVAFQNQYNSSAVLIATIKDMFQALINAVG